MTRFIDAETIDEACTSLREHGDDAKLVGGGTALVLLMQQRLVAPEILVGLRRVGDIPGWRDIEVVDNEIRIGGGVTLAEIAASRVVSSTVPSLSRAAGLVGNVRIRNMATLGGALAEADYASDPPAALVNLDAVVEISDGRSDRNVAAADFFVDYFSTALAPDEAVTCVRVPVAPTGTVAAYLKHCSRSTEDRPCVVVAATAKLSGSVPEALDVVVGAIGPTPQRWPNVLADVVGQPLDDATAGAVGDGYAGACQPLDDIRGSEWYRRKIVGVLVKRAVAALAPGDQHD